MDNIDKGYRGAYDAMMLKAWGSMKHLMYYQAAGTAFPPILPQISFPCILKHSVNPHGKLLRRREGEGSPYALPLSLSFTFMRTRQQQHPPSFKRYALLLLIHCIPRHQPILHQYTHHTSHIIHHACTQHAARSTQHAARSTQRAICNIQQATICNT